MPFFFLLLGLFACQSLDPDQIKLEKIYRKTIKFNVNGLKIDGVGIVPKQPKYQMRIYTPAKPNMLRITTCHRDDHFKKPGRYLDYIFSPVEIEKPPCLFQIAAFDEDGRNEFGALDFQGDETLISEIGCNGKRYRAFGASVCQAKVGLIQTIEFKDKVKVAFPERCPAMEKSGSGYAYVMGREVCVYLFSDGEKFHRHTTIGYEEVRND